MEPASPARLYAALAGVFLVALGVAGFFYGASFGSPGEIVRCLGVLRVNGWLNVLHAAVGGLGLLAASTRGARRYAQFAGLLFTALAVWGWALGAGESILGFLPCAGGDEALHLVLGLLGLGAAAATPKALARAGDGPAREPRGAARASA
jgi:hypothetical protein